LVTNGLCILVCQWVLRTLSHIFKWGFISGCGTYWCSTLLKHTSYI
jgi:hypothetical protein